MTQIVLNSPGEARGFLRAKGDTVELPDGSLRSYIWGRYGVVVDPSATVLSAPGLPTSAPPARADSLARSASVYREDAPPKIEPRVPRFRDRRLDAWNAAHGLPRVDAPRADDSDAPKPRFSDKRLEAFNAAHGIVPLTPDAPAAPTHTVKRDDEAKPRDRRAEAYRAAHRES